VDMAWVHLASYPIGMAALLAAWIGDYTRFAAGAFVFISGLSVARVFGPRLIGDPACVRATHNRLLRRALVLVCLDRLVAIGFTLIERSLSVPPTVTPTYPDLGDLLVFAKPGATGGLLALYAILLVATPLIDTALRRFGSVPVLAASVGLFAVAHAGGFGTQGGNWPFSVAYWQPLYVAGYVACHHLTAVCGSSGVISRRWLAVVSGAFVALFLLRNGVSIGLVAPATFSAWAFVKVPLSPAELAWYLTVSAFVLTWSAWIWEHATRIRRSLAWLPMLGRQSLLVYVAHLFVQLALVEALTLLDPSPAGRALMLPLMVLILVGIAAAGEAFQHAQRVRPTPSAKPSLLRRLPAPALMGGTVMAGTFGAVMALQLLIGPPATWIVASSLDALHEPAVSGEFSADIASAEGDDSYSEQTPLPQDSGGDGYPGSTDPVQDIEAAEIVVES
jgi:hypothetical protein